MVQIWWIRVFNYPWMLKLIKKFIIFTPTCCSPPVGRGNCAGIFLFHPKWLKFDQIGVYTMFNHPWMPKLIWKIIVFTPTCRSLQFGRGNCAGTFLFHPKWLKFDQIRVFNHPWMPKLIKKFIVFIPTCCSLQVGRGNCAGIFLFHPKWLKFDE